jgi:hypothetical protein
MAIGAGAVLLITAGDLLAEEYKKAVIKKIGDNLMITLQVNGQEVKATVSPLLKGFDKDGKELTGLGQNLRVLKEGNMVNAQVETRNKQNRITELRLVAGELQPIKPVPGGATADKPQPGKPLKGKPKEPEKVYKGAIVQRYQGQTVVLTVDDRDIEVGTFAQMMAYDATDHEIPKGDRFKILRKPGNVIDATTRKVGGKELLVEIRLIKGELGERDKR